MLVLSAAPGLAAAMEKDKDLVIGKIINIHSKILNEDRPLWVYVPDGYTSSQAEYPVLYLLDGSSHFHHVTGIIEVLSRLSRMPRMIVIAIPNTDRNRDFLPTRMDNFPPMAAADKFLAFLKEELIPFVDKNYRTVPYRTLCGHSFGGLFSIYSFLDSPELFNAYIIISPSVYWDDRLMFKKAEGFFQKHPGMKKFIFMTAAGKDKEAIRTATRDFAQLLEKKAPKGLVWQYHFMEKEDHGSTVHPTIYNALQFFYSGWRLSRRELTEMSLEDIRKHHRKLSERYGYEIPVPERMVDYKGYLLFREKKYAEAIEVLKFNVKDHPNSAYAYDRLGTVYEAAGKLDLAKTNYETAVRLAEKKNHSRLSTFRKNLSLLLEKMK
jgi:predicted alpha/beta superfamily hydrolase